MKGDKPDEELKAEALEAARKANVVIMCMGITPRLEGEEMKVTADGFRGGDRTRIDLPDVQQELIKEIHALGKHVVLVLLNGSALAINWEKDNIPAIIETWYGGQAAGQALADVIFGDYNPGGRLPVTFYKSVNDLPEFTDYKMDNRTYRYFRGEPLFPFGYGLSYATFKYSKFRVRKQFGTESPVSVSVTVKNTGKIAGEEVVQLYVSVLNATVPVPIRSLKGFKRVHLAPGESKTVQFNLPPDSFSIIDENFTRVVRPGKFLITAGGQQPQINSLVKESGVLKKMITML
jgi:beta-glucosidase